MCGVIGFWVNNRLSRPLDEIAKEMAERLIHRGPDDFGTWVDENVGIALAHRRLSIIDLSPAGHQPMFSNSKRFVIAFNGEIYNFLELRRELEKINSSTKTNTPISWRGHSDTEILLEAFETWGIENTLKKTIGMFAIALWDRKTRTLTLARDRMGEKPLYYGWVRNALVFTSELKALRAFPGFDNQIERRALALFLRHDYIPAPWTIYQNIWKLPPGSYIQFTSPAKNIQAETFQQTSKQTSALAGAFAENTYQSNGINTKYYWSLHEVANNNSKNSSSVNEIEAIEELDRLLRQSISGQMIADVPLGAFLSGGFDSSTVVAIMQALSNQPVKTFTIGFYEQGFNEAENAKQIAKHLGTDHTEWYLTPNDALNVIPKLPQLYDEPFADSSQIPTHLISMLARRHVTVSLSGDGGDELFGGYNRYFLAKQLWNHISLVPKPLKRLVASTIYAFSPAAWNQCFKLLAQILPQPFRLALPADKLYKGAALLLIKTPEEIYRRLISHWDNPSLLMPQVKEPLSPLTDQKSWLDCPEFEQRMMYLDAITYLPDDILVKLDRAAMGVSLETRVPFLDHRIVEFAWRLPLKMKIRNGQGKWLLRQVLYRYVPKSLVDRPKMGFSVPIEHWLCGPLKDWAESLLNETRLRNEGFFEPGPIRQKWHEHLSGQRNWAYHLWDILMFQAWLDETKNSYRAFVN